MPAKKAARVQSCLQIGEQEVAFGAKFRARVVLDIEVEYAQLNSQTAEKQ